MVFLCGSLSEFTEAEDPDFGVRTNQPYLERKVESFQWRETLKRQEAMYKPTWSSDYIDSSKFKDKTCINTPCHFKSAVFGSIAKIGNWTIHTSTFKQMAKVDHNHKGQKHVTNDKADSKNPVVGDWRASWQIADHFGKNTKAKISVFGRVSKSGQQIDVKQVWPGEVDFRDKMQFWIRKHESLQERVRLALPVLIIAAGFCYHYFS